MFKWHFAVQTWLIQLPCDYAYVIPLRTLISSALGVLTKWLKFSAIMDELFSKSVKAIPLDKPTVLL